MQCLRCGREILEEQVFCSDCQKVMEKHPVKPYTVVKIPERNIRERNQLRKAPKAEDDTEGLERKLNQLKLLVCMLLSLLLLSAGYISWQELHGTTGPSIGQNYTSVEELPPLGGR